MSEAKRLAKGLTKAWCLPYRADSVMKIRPRRCWKHRAALTTMQGDCTMAPNPLPSVEILRKLLECQPETGLIIWRERTPDIFIGCEGSPERAAASWNARNAGKRAFCTVDATGYLRGAMFKKNHFAHRVLWKWVHGAEPIFVDHVDGNRANNALHNLRSVTAIQNARNMGLRPSNTSGRVGVSFCKAKGLWLAHIGVEGKQISLGYYPTKDGAIEARILAEREFGFHENHGNRAAGDRP